MKKLKFDFRILIIICIVVSAAFGALAGFIAPQFVPKSEQQLIGEFYTTENAATMSPVDYLNNLQGNETKVLLVDLRIKSEYDASHFVGAVNVPAQDMSAEQLVSAFKGLSQGRPVLTYCYSEDCTLSQNVGLVLSQNGIYVKHLTAGWIEIQGEYSGYIVSGSAPGTLNEVPVNTNTACGANKGTFTC